MKALQDKTIRQIFVTTEDQSGIRFVTDEGIFEYETDSDCCSETWISDITGFSALKDAKVQSVFEIDFDGLGIEDGRTRQEFDRLYGYKFITNKGYADIAFRNSSNGYYGGSLYTVPQDYEITEEMTEITDDWRA